MAVEDNPDTADEPGDDDVFLYCNSGSKHISLHAHSANTNKYMHTSSLALVIIISCNNNDEQTKQHTYTYTPIVYFIVVCAENGNPQEWMCIYL